MLSLIARRTAASPSTRLAAQRAFSTTARRPAHVVARGDAMRHAKPGYTIVGVTVVAAGATFGFSQAVGAFKDLLNDRLAYLAPLALEAAEMEEAMMLVVPPSSSSQSSSELNGRGQHTRPEWMKAMVEWDY